MYVFLNYVMCFNKNTQHEACVCMCVCIVCAFVCVCVCVWC